ncbi:MAG: hypothetical protein WKF77_16735 [Planctomycetaceae bacterium]
MEIENPNNLPLVERINKAEHFARELCEHLQQAFLPKLSDLRSSSKKLDPEVVSDQTMFDQMSSVVKAEQFASDIYARLILYLESIRKDAIDVLGIGNTMSEIKERKTLVDIQDIVMEE